jgi:MFS family permease
LFWSGHSVLFLGSEITNLALPLTAVLGLGASPAQMGILTAALYLPYLFVGLVAGVWVDRYRRRPILIATDVVNAEARAQKVPRGPGFVVSVHPIAPV